jgi:predicted phage terminase large subunit-like protein
VNSIAPESRNPTLATESPQRVVRPQAGAQEDFLRSPADIAITGGKAGTGKTFGLLLEATRHIRLPRYRGTIFRRTYPQIMKAGSLWDTSEELYLSMGATPRMTDLSWTFPTGAQIGFAQMQHEQDRFDWDGAQLPFAGFDQMEHFTWKQFWHIVSRSRSTCGVKPYIRGTCNPDPDHFLRTFLDWWIDRESGFAIQERSGRIRWMTYVGDELVWGNSREDILLQYGPEHAPLSVTFIPGHLEENLALLAKDPLYRTKLLSLPLVERERLMKGNWNIRYTAGTYFKREWFQIVEAAPACEVWVRYWDRAATELKGDGTDQSATAGVLMGMTSSGMIVVKHVVRDWLTPYGVDRIVRNTATQDGTDTEVWVEEDPGQAGKAEAQHQVRNLHGFIAASNRVHESKGTRARMFSSQVEAGNVLLVRGSWNEAYLNEHENFDGTSKCRSDQVDASSGGYLMLIENQGAGVW